MVAKKLHWLQTDIARDSEITGFEVKLPRLNTGGRKISLAELSEKSMEKLINFYARDDQLLQDYYSPDKIWDEYRALKNQ